MLSTCFALGVGACDGDARQGGGRGPVVRDGGLDAGEDAARQKGSGGGPTDAAFDVRSDGGAGGSTSLPSPDGGIGTSTGGATVGSGGAAANAGDAGAPPDVLGIRGGSVTDSTGVLTLTFDPGALLGDTRFTFTPVSAADNFSADFAVIPGTAFRIDWTGAGFAPEGMVALTFHQAELLLAPRSRIDRARFGPNAAQDPYTVIKCEGYVYTDPAESSGLHDSTTRSVVLCEWDESSPTPPGPGSATVALAIPAPSAFPAITKELVSTGGEPGQSVDFLVQVTGAPPLKFEWTRDNATGPLDSSDPRYVFDGCDPQGAYCKLTVTNVQASDDGSQFKFTVSNSLGRAESGPATLKLCSVGTLPSIDHFDLPTSTNPGNEGINALIAGPNGNLWFSEAHMNLMNEISTAGVIQQHNRYIPGPLTVGPDGNVWFLEAVQGAGGMNIGRITSTGAVGVTHVRGNRLGGFASGGGYLWYTDNYPTTATGNLSNDLVARIDTAGNSKEFASYDTYVSSMAWGSDQNLWFTGTHGVGRLNPSDEQVTPFPVTGGASNIVAAKDGALWFVTASGIGRMTTAGTFTSFTTCGPVSSWLSTQQPLAIDTKGNVWFAYSSCDESGSCGFVEAPPTKGRLGRLTPSGDVTDYPVTLDPGVIAIGSDNNVWFHEGSTNQLGRFTPP